MKKSLVSIATLLLVAAAPTVSYAQVSFNAGVVSDYRYRGISQTSLKPALQAGVDYAGPNGIYLGAWGSTIKWLEDSGSDGKVEIDLYGGWKGEVAKGLTLDVGVLAYQYPSNTLPTTANTTEVYGALSYDIYTVKYSHGVTTLFGFGDSEGSGYIEASAAFDLGNGYTLTPHVGHQTVKNNDDFAYSDFSLALAKDLGNGLSVSGTVIATNADDKLYVNPDAKFTGRTTLVVGLKYSF